MSTKIIEMIGLTPLTMKMSNWTNLTANDNPYQAVPTANQDMVRSKNRFLNSELPRICHRN